MNKKVWLVISGMVVLGVVVALVLRHGLDRTDSPGEAEEDPHPAPGPGMGSPVRPTTVSNMNPSAASGKAVRPYNASTPVATILGLIDRKKDYNSRVKALRQLTRKIPDNDVAALRGFIDTPNARQMDMKPLEFNGLKNDLLDVLLRQDKVPAGMAIQLVSMYRNPEHDDVWRDYCVQYMATCYEAAKPTGVETNEPDLARRQIELAYWDALKETGKTIAGTALIAMEALSRTHPEFERDKVAKAALDLAVSDRSSEASRITALRLCGMTGATNVLPSARMVAQTGETIPLQMSAVATIGDLGDSSDRELLKSLSRSSEKRMKTVAEAALLRLEGRLSQGQ